MERKNNNIDISSEIPHAKIWTRVKKGKSKRRKGISSNTSAKQRHKDNVKAKIDKPLQNSQYERCGDRDEMINAAT